MVKAQWIDLEVVGSSPDDGIFFSFLYFIYDTFLVNRHVRKREIMYRPVCLRDIKRVRACKRGKECTVLFVHEREKERGGGERAGEEAAQNE